MGTVCYGIVKYLVVLVNFLFWIFGLVVIALAVWMLFDPKFYISMAQDSNHYYISTCILLAVGALLVIVAFLGCCGAFKESKCMLISFFCILLIVLVSQIASAVWAYTNAESLEPLVRSTMKMTVQEEYAGVESRRISFDTIQKGLHCCGAERPSDWMRSKQVVIGISSDPSVYTIPESCCRAGIDEQLCKDSTQRLKVGGEINTSVIYSEGCIDKVVHVIRSNAFIIVIVALTIMFVEIIGLCFALILLIAIKRSGRYKA